MSFLWLFNHCPSLKQKSPESRSKLHKCQTDKSPLLVHNGLLKVFIGKDSRTEQLTKIPKFIRPIWEAKRRRQNHKKILQRGIGIISLIGKLAFDLHQIKRDLKHHTLNIQHGFCHPSHHTLYQWQQNPQQPASPTHKLKWNTTFSLSRFTDCAQLGVKCKPHVFMNLYEFTGRTGLGLYRGLSVLWAANFSTATLAVCAEQRWMRR